MKCYTGKSLTLTLLAGRFFLSSGVAIISPQYGGDNLDDLVTILRERSQHADVLIVNGGLGPTSDDLSALAAATAKGEGTVLHEAAQRDGTLFPRTWTSNGTEQP